MGNNKRSEKKNNRDVNVIPLNGGLQFSSSLRLSHDSIGFEWCVLIENEYNTFVSVCARSFLISILDRKNALFARSLSPSLDKDKFSTYNIIGFSIVSHSSARARAQDF